MDSPNLGVEGLEVDLFTTNHDERVNFLGWCNAIVVGKIQIRPYDTRPAID